MDRIEILPNGVYIPNNYYIKPIEPIVVIKKEPCQERKN